ncbi:MAG: selenium cofactor biosynthesis protein YqeC, partial [Saprospiraceae bacterium]|nr:selenium cofactor biosynthesis protein YqeC [Saprospiraceae bacterium]
MPRPIRLTEAFRVRADSRIAIVGAGGKTSLLFLLARDFTIPVIVVTTTHLALEQASQADHHIILSDEMDLKNFLQGQIDGVTLVTGKPEKDVRLSGLSIDTLSVIEQSPCFKNTPILIEADGSRRLPLKAPA